MKDKIMSETTGRLTRHVISIDFEEWFQVNSFAERWSVSDWDDLECRLPMQTDILLETFDSADTKATFFIVGWVARRFPELVKRISEAGHEIASHSDEHKPIPDQSPGEFKQDLLRSKEVLEKITGEPVTGYRAPNWSLSEDAEWAIGILEEAGFKYDSSVFPIALRQGRKNAPRFPCRFESGLWEFPLSTILFMGQRIPVGGGVFFRAEPLWLTRYAIRHYERRSQPFILYLHPWEIDPYHPIVPVGIKKKFIHYHGLSSTLPKLKALLKQYTFTSFAVLMGGD